MREGSPSTPLRMKKDRIQNYKKIMISKSKIMKVTDAVLGKVEGGQRAHTEIINYNSKS
jgi:hypothetical protein